MREPYELTDKDYTNLEVFLGYTPDEVDSMDEAELERNLNRVMDIINQVIESVDKWK